MSGMDGKISNRDLRWWLKELARPRDAAATTARPEASDWESRHEPRAGSRPDRLVGGRNGNGRQNRHLRRKG